MAFRAVLAAASPKPYKNRRAKDIMKNAMSFSIWTRSPKHAEDVIIEALPITIKFLRPTRPMKAPIKGLVTSIPI
jgi:hypothetical protein